MNNTWQSTLEQHGARLTDNEVADFGDAAAEQSAALSENILCDLSHYALIRVSGDDSSNFLQGQLTNDVRQVNETRHQLSGYCSPKGRMLALFRLFEHDGAYFLRLPQALLAPTLKRLQMFVLMSKVTLEDTSEEVIGFGLSGPSAEELLKEQLGKTPENTDSARHHDGITVLRVAGSLPRFELYGDIEKMQPLWQALATRARPVGAQAWSLLDIHAGLPNVFPQTVEAFVPQMVNLQLVNGVSFKKGCYTGQEIVARMQYLGKLKRRMYLAHLETDVLAEPGDELTSPHSASGQGAGKVVAAARAPDGGVDLLCVIEITAADSGEVFLGEGGKNALRLESLPYSFEPSEQATEASGN